MPNDPAPYDHARAVSASAEAVKVAVEQAGELGHYVGDVLGSAPHELMDIVTMHIRAFKVRTAIRLYGGTKRRLEEAGLKLEDLRSPSASIEVPLLEAATMEDREDLAILWEKLLAAAIAPGSRDRVRARHIEILKALEPLDAWLLQNVERFRGRASSLAAAQVPPSALGVGHSHTVRAIREEIASSEDDIEVAFLALFQLGLINIDPGRMSQPHLTAAGRYFISVVNSVRPK